MPSSRIGSPTLTFLLVHGGRVKRPRPEFWRKPSIVRAVRRWISTRKILFAWEIAEGISLDVLEIDGASNNGVEQVRELRETVMFAPASGQFKIYYIDEVHMLTTAAFNALLKTLEEPPPHVKFIFATTEPQKILPTIVSRCQRFDLRRIPTQIIADQLKFIAKNESVEISDAAAYAIAKGAEGGMRDAQSMLDQMVAFCGNKIDEQSVLDIFGFNSEESIADLADAIVASDNAKALGLVHEHAEAGKDLTRFLGDLIGYFRHVLVKKVDPNAASEEISSDLQVHIAKHAEAVEINRLLTMIDHLAETDGKMKWAANKKLHLEIAMIKAIQSLGEASLDDVISMISGAASTPCYCWRHRCSTRSAKGGNPGTKDDDSTRPGKVCRALSCACPSGTTSRNRRRTHTRFPGTARESSRHIERA